MARNVKKEFKLSSWAIDNRMTVTVLTVLIFLAGLSSYISMPREAFPEVVTPEVYIGTAYPGNSPLDIEKLITRPLEKEINSITGVDEITSSSVQGYSSIDIKFNFDISPEEALRKVKDKVDIAKSDNDWPTDLPADPNVFEMNFSELMPIMNINLSGDFSMDQLKEYAEYLEDEIEGVNQVSKVEIRGMQEKEVEIAVDLLRMQSMELNFGDIANAITSENMNISGGNIINDGYRRNLRVLGEFNNMEEIENIIVKQENQEIVFLKDIAKVAFQEQEKESYARNYEAPVVMLDVMKRGGDNLLEASAEIDKILEDAKANVLPKNLRVLKTNDMSQSTESQVAELENSIIFGMLLVVGVLMFFLGLRNAMFVGIAIPLSMFLSFMILSAMGVTLNTMVLFSLVMALGMLVDNGIVVVENIYRLMDEGYRPIEAAKQGVGEVATPIIASTATTLAAFLPLAFWPGMMGEFMKYLPITLIIVLGSSLFVALVINPVLTSVYMKLEEEQVNRKKLLLITSLMIVVGAFFIAGGLTGGIKMAVALGNLLVIMALLGWFNVWFLSPATHWFQEKFMPVLEAFYERTLRFALKGNHVYFFFFGTIGLLFMSFVLFGIFPPKVLFFPENQPNQVMVYIEKPIGTDIEVVNDLTKELETKVLDAVKKYEITEEDENGAERTFNYMVKSVIAQVGEGTSDPNQGPSLAQTPNKAKISVELIEFSKRRGTESQQVLDEIREALQGYPGVTITVDKDNMGPPAGAPINIELSSKDYEQLMTTAKSLVNHVNASGIRGIEELKLDVEQGKPELMVEVDRQRARRYNVSTGQIGDVMRTALYGKEISTYKEGEDDYPINIRLQERYRRSEDALMNQMITFRDQTSGKIQQVPVSAVASRVKSSTYSAVKRKDLKRVITVHSNVIDGYNANEIVGQIQTSMVDFEMPEGIAVSFTGEQEKQAEEMEFLSTALLIAVFSIFLILVTQFNSASTPFIIVTSVILSLTGVFMGLVTFNMDFVIMMTMIGIISLAGIVVNNAIVLIDYTNIIMERKRVEQGLETGAPLDKVSIYESLVESGKTRLRPVLLTAITTILGLVPLAIGLNINFITLFTSYDPQFFIGGDNVIFWGPMSWAIIFGLTFATFLTLVIVPVMYNLLLRGQLRFMHKSKVSEIAHTSPMEVYDK